MLPEVIDAGEGERARHLRRVDRVLQRASDRDGLRWRPPPGSICAPTSSSSTAIARCRWRWRRGRARSITCRRCHADDVAPLAAAECAAVLLPGGGVPRRRAPRPRAGAARRGRDLVVLATDVNPGTSPVVSMPLVIGLARAGTGCRRSRRSRRHAERRLDARRSSTRSARSRSASAPTCWCSTVPVDQIAYRFGHNPVLISVIGGEIAYVRDDADWRVSVG